MTSTTVAHDETVDTADMDASLAPGVDLLGSYTDTGYSQPQYLLRRPDGQVILVSRLLYLVAAALRHQHHLSAVARTVSERTGRPLTAQDIDHLLRTDLHPAGTLATYGHRRIVIPRTPRTPGRPGRFGFAVPDRLLRGVTAVMRPLCHLPVAANALALLALVDLWILSHHHTLSAALERTASQPGPALATIALLLGALAFHEIGHATACRSSGAHPETLRIGLRLGRRLFDADVTDAYRLDRTAILRTHAGGVYFDTLYALTAAAAYAATSYAPLLAAVVLSQLHALIQVLPLGHLDGYHLLSRLAGVPNLFTYTTATRTHLLALRPATRRHARRTLDELNRPARRTIRTWTLLTVTAQTLTITAAAYTAHGALPPLWRTIRRTAHHVTSHTVDGHWPAALGHAAQLSALALPALTALVLTALTAARRLTAHRSTPRHDRPTTPTRIGLALLLTAAVLLSAAVGAAIGRLNTPDPATATTPLPTATTATTANQNDVPTPRPTTTNGTTPTAAGPSEGGQTGPAAPPPSTNNPTAPASAPTTPATAPAASIPAAGAASTPASPAAVSGDATWTVQPGQHLWSIAEAHQAHVLGRTPTEQETGGYWAALVAANVALLADPSNPDLIFSGQVLVLPRPY